MIKKILTILLMFLMISFVACSSDDDDAKSDRENTEAALKQLDQTLANMTVQSSVFVGISQMPPGLIDDVPFGPLMPPRLEAYSLSKKSVSSYAIQADSTFIMLLEALNNLYGTHTYNADTESWDPPTNTPSNEVVIIYPFIDINDNSQHMMQLRLYGVDVDNVSAEMSFEVKVDGTTQLTAELTLLGSNLTNPDAETTLTSVSVSGTITDDSGTTFNYSFSVTNTQMQFTFGAAGSTSITLTATGQGIFDSVTEDQDPQIDEISLEYGNVELVINNIEATEGDVGDLYYDGNKIADLVIVDGEPYIDYTDGDRVALMELMPNAASLSFELP